MSTEQFVKVLSGGSWYCETSFSCLIMQICKFLKKSQFCYNNMFRLRWQWTLDGNDIVSWRMPTIPPKQLWTHYHVWDRGCVCFPKREEKPSIPAPYSYLPRFRQERQMTEWPIIRTRLSTFKIGFYGQHGWRWFIILSGLCLKKENQPLFPSVLFCLKM